MNNLIKIIIAILGGTEQMFKVFIPIALAITLTVVFELKQVNSVIVISTGLTSSAFRALKPLIQMIK